ncbi:MAG TPA: FKBP-type peptidyl-prolyl cis-trans isomerase [Solirubrobacterales bacterium]
MRVSISILALCAVLAVAGCGGDDSTTESTETTQATTTEAPPTESTAPKQAKPEATKKAKPASKQAKPEASKAKPKVTVPSGPPPKRLEVKDIETGSGATAKAGDVVSVEYVGVGYESGQEFDASWGREPFTFQLGAGMVIPGWDQGVEGMKVGGRRELIIPPELAYGEIGSPPSIGPNETLIFVIDLLAVE